MPDHHEDAPRTGRPLDSATVVICAYTEDRWATLQHAIDVTRKQMAPDDELVLVIDHNESLLRRCQQHLDGCLVVPNSQRRGLSGARNTALQHARGSIIVFLDDDAVPLDGWLEALRAPYADELVYGVGGFARPCWPGAPPQWFPEEFLWVVGCSHRGLPHDMRAVRNFLGANMSFRRTAFEQVGQFADNLGRTGNRPLGCEETEFCIRLTQANADAILLYDPSAQVEHHVATQRKSLRYFVKRCWAEGISKAEVSRLVGRSHALSSERDYTRRVLPSGIWHGLSQTFHGNAGGAARSVAIVTGLAVTTAGYCRSALYGRSGTAEEKR